MNQIDRTVDIVALPDRRQKPPSVDLSRVLQKQSWALVEDPFPHIRAANVFTEDIYRSMEVAFLETQQASPGSSEKKRSGFSRSIPTFDALIGKIPDEVHNPLRLFVSQPWHDLLASLFAVNATGDMNAELHHHPVGSGSGRIHNDLNPGWFPEAQQPGEINLSNNRLCSYKYGTTTDPSVRPVERVRAVAMIFYLANPRWRHGDGGTTGLYRTNSDPVDVPFDAMPPVNNSFVAFACTPFSFHSFISNTRSVRNSVVLWLHSSYNEAVSQWGESVILKWPKPR